MNKNEKKNALLCAAGCAVLIFCETGLFSAPTIFLASISEELGVSVGSLSFYVTLQTLAMALCAPVSIRLLRRGNVNLLMTAALAVISAAAFGMSFSRSTALFYVFGAVLGIGCSFISYMAIPVILTPWFPKNQGTALAVVLSFIGIGSTVFNTVGSYVITHWGWRSSYRVLSLMAFLPALPCVLFLIRKKEDISENAAAQQHSSGTMENGKSLIPGLITAACFCMLASSYAHMTSYVRSLGYPLTNAAACTSAYMLGVTAGKFVIGISSDRFGLSKTLGATGATTLLSAILYTLHPSGYIFLMICAFVMGIGAANNSLLSPLLVRELYSEESYADMLSLYSLVTGVLSALAITGFGYLYDFTSRYETIFLAVSGFVALGTGMGLLCLRSSAAGKSIHSCTPAEKDAQA